MQIFPDTDTVLLPPFLSMSDTKPNKSKRAASKSIEKVYVNQIISNDKMDNIKDIFIYDISAGWFHAKIIAKLKNHTKPLTIFSHYLIKAFKHFNSGGKSQIVTYFERYHDAEFCHKTTFNFNHNSTDYSFPWCASPISFQNKNKKPMKNSNKQNFGSPKARFTNFKPTKDQAKSSKKLKDKKKKKSSVK
ncbi:hypothetical protein RCL_jg14662.t1 [Rhizophagus clarus]|uniref:Uncharacterized protein n=1 Tax=Rhizophagus clarus TaxID=94130 RepID=A0A8H3M4V2_9GLOM|nr:hypothetical protein RCL_jg14662.t1 [Rhizophagus clarus]